MPALMSLYDYIMLTAPNIDIYDAVVIVNIYVMLHALTRTVEESRLPLMLLLLRFSLSRFHCIVLARRMLRFRLSAFAAPIFTNTTVYQHIFSS